MDRNQDQSTNLDFLRTLAVLCVFFSHLLKYQHFSNALFLWHLGQIGVLAFFVHTSLVLMLSLERENKKGSFLFISFYIRRLFRIYPLSMFFILVVYTLKITPGYDLKHEYVSITQLFANLTLTQNLFYIKNIFEVLWSLPIEINMYIFLPFLYLIGRKTNSIFILGLWCVSVLIGLVQLDYFGRLNVLGYSPCFIAGILTWQLNKKVMHFLPSYLFPVALLMTSIIWFSAPKENDMIFRWIFCLVLGLTLPFFKNIKEKYLNFTTKVIAKYSYGIYITHTIGMTLSFIYIENYLYQWLCFIILTFALPFISYHAIEEPGIKLGKLVVNKIK